jgi:hypothetical protein
VYVYRPEGKMADSLYRQLTAAATRTGRLISDPDSACLFLVGVPAVNATAVLARLPGLSHWQGDGRNHLLVSWGPDTAELDRANRPGRYMIAQPHFSRSAFQLGFDLVVPVLGPAPPKGGPVWSELPDLVPILRKYLLYFSGEQNVASSSVSLSEAVEDSLNEDAKVVEVLKRLQSGDSGTSDRFLLSFRCEEKEERPAVGAARFTDWRLCGAAEERQARQLEATFSLILPPSNSDLVSTRLLQLRLFEALKASFSTGRGLLTDCIC